MRSTKGCLQGFRSIVSTYIQLGKIGDILSLLPVLHNQEQLYGEPQRLIVSREYAHVVEGLDYVEPVVWPGDWMDLKGAIRDAKRTYGDVIIPQTFAKDYNIQRHHPSWQYDQWERAGMLNAWGHLPLKLPRRPQSPCSFLWTVGLDDNDKFILVADHSQSSPFAQAESLIAELESIASPLNVKVVRLSSVRVANIIELLPLYDAAALIVTVDTMHLHLAKATSTPVIALSTDTQGRWRGSAWHPSMLLHVRYGDYEQRKAQVLHEAGKVLAGHTPPPIKAMATPEPLAYNPSILKVGGNLWTTYRHHPEIKSWRTEMRLMTSGQGFKSVLIKPPEKYDRHSHEDGRLFTHKGQPHISLTIARSKQPHESGGDKCIIGFGKLSEDGKITDWVEPKYGVNNWTSMEKNWVFWSSDKLRFFYRLSPTHEVCELEGEKVTKVYKSECPPCNFGEPRGGTSPVLYQGKLLRFFHAMQRNEKSDLWWTYHVGAMLVEPTPPFKVVAISKHPIYSGTEEYVSGHKYWKPRVAIPYGVIETGYGWDVSLGINDFRCATLKVGASDLNL
jgi:hypothetical protein